MSKKRIFVISLLVILSVVLLFILINKNQMIKMGNDNDNNKVEKIEIAELDLNSKLVNDLYKYILKENVLSERTVYQNKKININHLDDIEMILTVISNAYNENEYYKKDFDNYKEYHFNKKVIDDKAKDIFGDNVSLKLKKSFKIYGRKIDFVNDEYIFTEYLDAKELPYYSKNSIVKAEKSSDNVYIYDKYIHVIKKINDYEDIRCYNTSDRRVLLLEKKPTGSKDDEIEIEDIKDAPTFKHTFTKNNDGKYYWVSTEIVK